MKVKISEQRRNELISMFLLKKISENSDHLWSALLEGDDKLLEKYLTNLHVKGYTEFDRDGYYVVTEKGENTLKSFEDKDRDFIRRYDVFCAVDTDDGEFAFESFFDIDEERWADYLDQERWSDIRIPIAELHGIDPVEMIFIAFINDDIISTNESGWQFELCMGVIFNTIEDIIETAFSVSDFEILDDDGNVELSGKDHLTRYLEKGNDIMKNIIETQTEIEYEESDYDDFEEYTEESVIYEEEMDYLYEHYTDVYYVNPCWSVPIYIDLD